MCLPVYGSGSQYDGTDYQEGTAEELLEIEYRNNLKKEGKIKNRVYVCGLGWMLPTVVVYGCGCGYGEEDDVYGGEEYSDGDSYGKLLE